MLPHMNVPLLAPHVHIAWRDPQRLVLEDPAAPQTQVLIGNATASVLQWLRRCDGTRSLPAVLDAALEAGIGRDSASAVLQTLADAGLLTLTAPTAHAPADALSGAALRQDLESLALCGRDADAAYRRRREHHIWIEGVNRVAHALVDVLAASHIGSLQARVQHASRRNVTLRDIGAFGPQPDDVGQAPSIALRRHIERVAHGRPGAIRRPVAIACDSFLDPGDESAYQEAGMPYLRVLTTSRYATIGPLTLPGETACWSCIAMHRADADPDWPHLLAQFEQHRRTLAPIDDSFAMWVASEAAARLLRVIDTDDPSSLVNTTLHIDRTDQSIRVRTWRLHPECACQWRLDRAA